MQQPVIRRSDPPLKAYWIMNGRGQTEMGDGLLTGAQTLPLLAKQGGFSPQVTSPGNDLPLTVALQLGKRLS